MASVSVTIGYGLDLKHPPKAGGKGSAVGWPAFGPSMSPSILYPPRYQLPFNDLFSTVHFSL